jgi:hypothetical protein
MQSGTKRIAIVGAVVVVAAGIAAYFLARGPSASTGASPQRTAQQQPDAQQRGQPRRRGAVSNRVVVARVVVRTVAAVGTGRAIRSLTLSAEVAGVIEDIRFKPGEQVKAGQEVLKLRSEAEELAVKIAQVKLDDAGANLKRLQGLAERNAVPAVHVDQPISNPSSSQPRASWTRTAAPQMRALRGKAHGVQGRAMRQPNEMYFDWTSQYATPNSSAAMPVVIAALSHNRGRAGAPGSCPSASSPARRMPQGRTAKNTIHQMRTNRTTPLVQVTA